MPEVCFAFDKQTARSFDADGRMRVRDCILSTAEVNPYRGREVVGYADLGLDPNRIYDLYRDPTELGHPDTLKSFEGLPLMIKHVAQTADNPRKEYVGGSVHNVRFDGKHLRGDLLVWDGYAIDLIESDELSDLSCGYRYVPVMRSGDADGQAYDGRMTAIRGNHVALVDDGRASGAHVADAAFRDPRAPNPTLNGDNAMPFPENEQPGAGAPPAAGAQPADAAPAAPEGGGNELATIGAALKQLVEQNAQAHAAILQKLEQLGGGAAPAPGAQDGEPDGVRSPQGSEDNEMPGAEDNEEEGPTPRADDEHESAEDNELNPAGGENPTVKPNPHEGYAARGEAPPFGAMDAKSVKTAIETAVANERKRAAAVEQAKRDVRYVLGGDIALDSASQIYREALTQIGVDVSQVAKGSERAAWQAANAASIAAAHGRTIQPAHAMDSAGANEAASRIDANLAKIKVRG